MKKNPLYLLSFLFLTSFICAQNPFKAPLYWSVYEHHIVKEYAGIHDNYIPEAELMKNVDWVDQNLRELGYTMICLDGWGDDSRYNEYGYRTTHSSKWEHDYAWWSQHLQGRGMQLGMYGNPLWVIKTAAEAGVKIKGTNIPLKNITNYDENATWFTWVQVNQPGAEEYVKGYVQHFADMGIKYFRVDFLSWFEDGTDQNMGRVGANRPKEDYETALRWMKEACDANGMFLSLVMPHLKNDAELEQKYGHMIRINDDVSIGTWEWFSNRNRGKRTIDQWSQYDTAFDGYIYWSKIAGRNKMILDGDFIRINTYANNEEKKSVISLHTLAGGPISIADQPHTIGQDLWLYQNKELLALNQDGFVAQPLTNDPTQTNSQIWKGQTSNGEWIVGLFNRENTAQNRTIDFSSLGIVGNAKVRDLWKHENIGTMNSFSASVPAHGCVVLKVVPEADELSVIPAIKVKAIEVLPQTEAVENQGQVKVTITDLVGNPTPYANVTVAFTGSFNESVSALTDENGVALLTTLAYSTGTLKISVCVTNVAHTESVYAADKNEVTCRGGNRYVGGTFNNWTLGTTPMLFENGVWVAKNVNILAGSHQLKFADTNDWSGDDWGNATGLTGTASLTTGGKPNVSFVIVKTCNCTIIFNEDDLTYTIETNQPTQTSMYVAGTFSNWDLTKNPMTLNGNVWEAMVSFPAGNHELKFANTSNWSGDDWGNNIGFTGTAKLTTGGDPNITFNISDAKEYKVTFNDQTLAYVIESFLSVYDPKMDANEVLTLFPNPADDEFNVLSSYKIKEVSVFNTAGNLVLESKSKRIDATSLSDGIYFVRITDENDNSFLKKIVIRH
jgi:hypothetical protein